jgi:hypothetical protein
MLAAEPYRPDPEMPWRAIAAPLARAEDALARLDERLSRSPVRDGWIARTHFGEACAALWLEGELTHSRTSFCMTPAWTCARPPTN